MQMHQDNMQQQQQQLFMTTMLMMLRSNNMQRQVEVTGVPGKANIFIPPMQQMLLSANTIPTEGSKEGLEEGK